jgi:Putative MetA-pathway of phenol degradation
MRFVVCAAVLFACITRPAAAQQRPLLTEDPEAIGAGRILIEGGIDFAHNQEYPTSGLEGDLWRIPTLGVSLGISSIAEVQIDGGIYNGLSIKRREEAPLSDQLDITGDSTSDIQDLVIGTKIRLLAESAKKPAVGVRAATKLPNATNASGLGTDTTDFYASLLVAKTVRSVRLVGNIGVGILMDPTVAASQNDVVTYGFSLARALTDRAELVGELNGRTSTRNGEAPPGTETRSLLNLGARYTTGSFRLDGSVFFGFYSADPSIGFGGGFTYVFTAFEVP